MTREELDQKLTNYVEEHQYIDGDLRPVPTEHYLPALKQLIIDILDEVVPEKQPDKGLINYSYNRAIDTITEKRKGLGV